MLTVCKGWQAGGSKNSSNIICQNEEAECMSDDLHPETNQSKNPKISALENTPNITLV